jgi:hypothetical protein
MPGSAGDFFRSLFSPAVIRPLDYSRVPRPNVLIIMCEQRNFSGKPFHDGGFCGVFRVES